MLSARVSDVSSWSMSYSTGTCDSLDCVTIDEEACTITVEVV